MKSLLALALTLLSFSLMAQIPTNGLIAQYKFDLTYGDSSMYSNHATNRGTIFKRDRCFVDSNALYFNGINDYLDLGKLDSLNQHLESHSIAFWLKTDGNAGDVIYGTSDQAGAGLAKAMYFLRVKHEPSGRITSFKFIVH